MAKMKARPFLAAIGLAGLLAGVFLWQSPQQTASQDVKLERKSSQRETVVRQQTIEEPKEESAVLPPKAPIAAMPAWNSHYPKPERSRIRGEVLGYRSCELPPKEKGGKSGELREWLIKPSQGHTVHVEESQYEGEELALAEYVANQIVLVLNAHVDFYEFREAMAKRGAIVKEPLMEVDLGAKIVAVMSEKIEFDTVAELQDGVIAFDRQLVPERDVVKHPTRVPNDNFWNHQYMWGMKRIGAPEAWDTRTDSSSILVAVLDTGIDYEHMDLKDNIWNNPSPGTYSGVSGDLHGFRCVGGVRSGDPMDDDGHGTHVAGTIGAVGDNSSGVTGVAWKAKIMALKFIAVDEASGETIGSTTDEIVCLDYARAKGVKVINCSFGNYMPAGYSLVTSESSAFTALKSAGILVCCSAGNDGQNTDSVAHWPSSHPHDNIISVAATDANDQLCTTENCGWGSNYGATSIDIAAPGDGILSTIWKSDNAHSWLAVLGGTSMATPHVTGAAALIWAQYPSENYQQIIQRIYNAGEAIPSLNGKVSTGKLLNIANAFASTQLSAPTDISATKGTYTDKVFVTWSSVTGATHYRVWRGTASAGNKTLLGSYQTGTFFNDTTATAGVTYWYCVTAASSASGANESELSAPVSGYKKQESSSGDAWDPTDDTESGATSITPTSSVVTHGPHTLSKTDQYDWFKFSMVKGKRYRFNVEDVSTCSGTDYYFAELYSGNQRLSYYFFGNSNLDFVYVATNTATAYLSVKTSPVGNAGEYTLKYSMEDAGLDSWDPGDDTASGGTLIVPSANVATHGPHTLSATDQYDWFRIAMTAGTTYTFESTGSDDTYGELYNSPTATSGNCVAYDDDSGSSRNFKIQYTPATSGTYYLRVYYLPAGKSLCNYSLQYIASSSSSPAPSSKDLVFCPYPSFRNWPANKTALITAQTNDLSEYRTEFTTTDKISFWYGWKESSGQNCSLVTNVFYITQAGSTKKLRAVENSYQGSNVTGNYASARDWQFAAGSYVAHFHLNEDYKGNRGNVVESDYDNNVQEIAFTVRNPAAAAKTLSSIAISGNAQVTAKGNALYKCRASYSDNTSEDVAPTWSISSGENCATINSAGTLSAANVSAEQSVTIRAEYNGKVATKSVKIVPQETTPVAPEPVWHDVVTYPNPPMIVEAVVSINGELAQPGDQIAAFYGEELRGTATIDVNGRVTMSVSYAETGERISFQVWDASEGDEGTIYPVLQTLSSTSEPQGTIASPISLEASANDPFGDPVPAESAKPMIIEAMVTIDGVPASTGDVLGIFDGDKLLAKNVLSYGASSSGGDPIAYCTALMFFNGTKTLSFKVWDASEAQLVPCKKTLQVNGSVADPIGTPNNPYLIEATTFNEDDTPCDVNLGVAGWNLVSFSVLPSDASPANVFADVRSSISYVVNGTSLWSAESGSGNLAQLRIGEGYWVRRTSQQSVSWTVEGSGAPDTKIALKPGWNLIGYTLPRPGNVDNVLATALASGKISYIVTGNTVYPRGGLTTMAPGIGYWVRASGNYELSFDRAGMVSGAAQTAAAYRALAAVNSGPFTNELKMATGFPTILDRISFEVHGKAPAIGDVVALFDKDSGELYAVTPVEDDKNSLMFPVYTGGASIKAHFRIWNVSSGLDNPEIFDADADSDFLLQPNEDGIFDKHIVVSGTKPSYTVTYNLADKAVRTGGGELTQSVPFGGDAVDPEIKVSSGWKFRAWDHSKRTDIRANTVISALYDQTDEPINPDPEKKYVTVTFDAGGGTGTMEPQTFEVDVAQALSQCTFAREGYVFWYWQNSKTYNTYYDGEVVPFAEDTTLVAVWYELREFFQYGSEAEEGMPLVASVWNGILSLGPDGIENGSIQVKLAKAKLDKKSGKHIAKLTAKIVLPGQKAISIKGNVAIEDGFGTYESGDLYLAFGKNGMEGSYKDWYVQGARNLFTSKTKTEVSSANAALAKWKGTVCVEFNCEEMYGTLSCVVGTKGKVKATGMLSSGTKVSVSTQLILGEKWHCIPIVWAKKSERVAFALWLDSKGDAAIVDSDSNLDGYAGRPGVLPSSFVAYMTSIEDSDIEETFITDLYPEEEVAVSGSKFVTAKAQKVSYKDYELSYGSNPSALKLSYAPKTGIWKGSFYLYSENGKSLKKTKATMQGVIIDGEGFGYGYVKKHGPFCFWLDQ